MARYEDVLVGGEGLRDYIQDLWSKLVERERLGKVEAGDKLGLAPLAGTLGRPCSRRPTR